MHHTREAAKAGQATAKDAGAPPDGNQKKQADESAIGGRDSESNTGKTEEIGATIGPVPTESLESQANTYTREVAKWLTSLAKKASEQALFLPTILNEMCPFSIETRQKILLGFGFLEGQCVLRHDASS